MVSVRLASVIGSFIPLPYIDIKTFSPLLQSNNSTTTIATILNNFSGGGNASFSIFSLGILPNINASIIIQLLTTINPKDEGEYGRRKLIDYTRYLTFFCAVIESLVTTYSFKPLIFNWNLLVLIQNIFISFFIGGIFLVTTIGCIYINEAVVKIPLVSASQLLRNVNKFSSWNNSNLPLRVNQAGVMPLVFTSSVMVILTSITKLLSGQLINITFFSNLTNVSVNWTLIIGKICYWLIYSISVFFFTSFYSTIILDPKDITEQFRKNSVETFVLHSLYSKVGNHPKVWKLNPS